MASTTPQKKRRLSNLFGAKKNKDKDQAPNGANHDLHPSTSTAAQPDSAYASSAPTSSKRNSTSEMVPVENSGNIEGVSPDRNLALNKNTGQVVDDDTGQVVVTTTTTTTTTVTKGGQKGTKVEVSTEKDGQPAIAEAPGDMPQTSSTTSHSPAPPHRHSPNSAGPSPVGLSAQNTNSPGMDNHGAPQPYAPPRTDPDTLPVPARNPMREREPMDPVSPIRPNFSYPSRTDLREDPMPQQAPAPKSTFGNLKAAAQGLHGVGETVRGTFNNEIDSRFPRSNSQKAATANAKNQAVLENGNREMARVSMGRAPDSQAPPVRSPAAHEPVPSQLTPGPPQQQWQQQQYPPPPSEPVYGNYGGSPSYGGNSSNSEMSQVPSSFSPESSAPEQKKSSVGGLKKLVKRRTVGPT